MVCVPYKVVQVKGKRVTSKRDEKVLTRDKNHVKVVPKRPSNLCPSFPTKNIRKHKLTYHVDDNLHSLCHHFKQP